MAKSHSFRFGTSVQATSRAELIEQVQMAEKLGYSALTVTDHLSMPRLAPIATLAAMAIIDSPLRLTSTVFGNDFRHPAILASEATAIDIISNGRLELGIGTGYWKLDYTKSGISYDPPGARVDRLVEAIQIMKGLFADHAVTFSGENYSISDLNMMPKPIQRPHPPFLIGGGGKRMLTLAAKEADIVSINTTSTGGTLDFATLAPDLFQQKVGWVHRAAGARMEELELHSMLFHVEVTDDQEQAARDWIRRMGTLLGHLPETDAEDAIASPYVLIGTIGEMVAKLRACREQYGVSYFTPSSHIPMKTLSPIIAQLVDE